MQTFICRSDLVRVHLATRSRIKRITGFRRPGRDLRLTRRRVRAILRRSSFEQPEKTGAHDHELLRRNGADAARSIGPGDILEERHEVLEVRASRDRAALNSVITKLKTSLNTARRLDVLTEDCGCPMTAISPSRSTSTPTEIMLVASTTSGRWAHQAGYHQLRCCGIWNLRHATSSQLAARVFSP